MIDLNYHQRWYQENKERIKAQHSAYYEENRELILTRNRAAYNRDKIKISENRKTKRQQNPEKFQQINRKYYANNKEKVLKRTGQYYQEHKAEHKQAAKTWREKPCNRIRESVLKAKNHGAPRRNLEFDDKLFTLTKNPPTNCKCCGCELDYSVGNNKGRKRRVPTLDRVDNSKGYLLENTFIICMRCNALKSDATLEEITNIYNYMTVHVSKEPPNG